MKAKNELAQELIDSFINNSDEWDFNRFHAINKKWGISVWIANGISFISIECPTRIQFSYFDKMNIYKAMKKCRDNKIIKMNRHD